jgi:hypothetical protein
MSDETKPWDGRPENPERDGLHWLCHQEDLRPVPMPWNAEYAAWCSGGMHSPQGVIDLGWRYLGPCLLPDEHAALLAERDALRAERDDWQLIAERENRRNAEQALEAQAALSTARRAGTEGGQ